MAGATGDRIHGKSNPFLGGTTMTMPRLILSLVGISALGFVCVSAQGCALLDVVEAKNSMDWSAQSGAPAATVWAASVKAADDLGVVVDSKDFDGKNGEIAGHAGQLDYIRIYVTEITAKATRIDIQSRTAVMPMFQSGYDRGFAMAIANKINYNLRHPIQVPAGEPYKGGPLDHPRAAVPSAAPRVFEVAAEDRW